MWYIHTIHTCIHLLIRCFVCTLTVEGQIPDPSLRVRDVAGYGGWRVGVQGQREPVRTLFDGLLVGEIPLGQTHPDHCILCGTLQKGSVGSFLNEEENYPKQAASIFFLKIGCQTKKFLTCYDEERRESLVALFQQSICSYSFKR